MVQSEFQTRGSAHHGRSQKATALERWGLLLGGGALTVFALTRRRPRIGLAATGGLLAYRGATFAGARCFRAEASFAINCSPEEAYRFWHNFENLPLFMRHLESVRARDGRSEWRAVAPLGAHLQWTAETIEDRENEYIAWRSEEGSEFDNSGSVEFRRAPGNRGTIVRAVVHYDAPGGALGKAVAAVFGKDPEFAIREDLRRFKALMEMGEIPTTEGQSHGPRSAKISILHAFYPERRKASEYRIAEHAYAQRRAS
jgi:uncharacterized membrane protein